MRLLMGFFFVMSGVSVAASDTQPVKYLARMNGVVIEGLATHREVQFSPGSLEECKKTVVGTKWTSHRCPVTNGYLLITRTGALPVQIKLERTFVVYTDQSIKEEPENILRYYTYFGSYEEVVQGIKLNSKVEIRFDEWDNNPGDVKGWIKFVDYRYELPLQMAYAP